MPNVELAWVVVSNAGTELEKEEAAFTQFPDACTYVTNNEDEYYPLDIMKRLPDNTLTTVY